MRIVTVPDDMVLDALGTYLDIHGHKDFQSPQWTRAEYTWREQKWVVERDGKFFDIERVVSPNAVYTYE